MSDAVLPAGWMRIPLGKVGTWVGGGTPSKSNPSFWRDGTIPWVSPKDMKVRLIREAEDRITEEAVSGSTTKLVPAKSVLIVTRSGILERTLPVALTSVDVTLNQDMKAIVPNDDIDSAYLSWVLKSREKDILTGCRKAGTTVASIETSMLERFEVPVAPLPEQRRIVAALEEHLSELDAAVAGLERARARLHSFLYSRVKAMLEDSSSDRGSRVSESSLASLFASITQGWSPKCDGTPPASSEWGVIMTTAVQPMHFDDTAAKRLPRGMAPRDHIEIEAGDLLITRKGPRARAGVACAVRTTRPKLMVCDTVYKVRVVEELVRPYFLSIAMSEPSVVAQIDAAKAGINDSGVSLTHDRLGAVRVRVPPLRRQEEIEALVDSTLEEEARLRTSIDRQLARSAGLRHAILKHAFEGKLVPQDPNDEPSSALIERIRVSRGNMNTRSAPNSRTTTRSSRRSSKK